MKRTEVSSDYIEAMQRFTSRLEREMGFHIVYSQAGKKYDKVIAKTKNGSERVLFFVARDAGTIYGKKSDTIPNFYWWFNTLYTAYLWDWGGWPEPVKDKSVKCVYTYGGEIKHYQPISAVTKKPTKKHKALDMEKVGV